LKQFDQSTLVSRKDSQSTTPPLSVKGIGGKGAHLLVLAFIPELRRVVAKPDYSESKIVLAMVPLTLLSHSKDRNAKCVDWCGVGRPSCSGEIVSEQ
jgi:hypothetical protein